MSNKIIDVEINEFEYQQHHSDDRASVVPAWPRLSGTPDTQSQSSDRHPRGGHNRKPIALGPRQDPSNHIGLIGSVARRFIRRGINRGFTFNELMSMGYFGLHRACELFDESLGFRFSTYAMNSIARHMLRVIVEESHLIYIPRNTASAALKRWEETPSPSIGGRRLPGMSDTSPLACAARALALIHFGGGDMDEAGEGGGENPVSLAMLADPRSANGTNGEEDDPDSEVIRGRIVKVLSAMSLLPVREQQILSMRFGLDRTRDPMTLGQIGSHFGVTQERIRQLEAKAMNQIRYMITNEFY